MKQWLKISLLLFSLLSISESYSQGYAQCKPQTEQSNEDVDFEVAENHELKNKLILNYVILPIVVLTAIVLMIVFRKRIASLFQSKRS